MDKIPLSLVAIINNQCVGVVSFFENDLQTKPDLSPWLAGLYVHENYRGQGIAQKLIKGILDVGKSLDFDKIYLRTEHSARYYEKLGWAFLENAIDEYAQETSIFCKDV